MNHDIPTMRADSPSLASALNDMETAQLVRRLDEGDLAYLFKHALVQDTAYASLMRHDRKRLHLLVGQALEQANVGQAAELAPRLAAHFDQAGDTPRALLYFERAAADAAARYANPEALDFYTSALDAAEELRADTRDSLYRARGQVYERIGNFDAARADLEKALQIARATHDTLAEWQSLIDLGFAWLARDYARAGEFFEQALELARASADAGRVAHTLNRVGNLYLNYEDPSRALAYHTEALSLFQQLGDTQGLAETEDLLGMTSLVGSNLFAAREHFTNAQHLFENLDDTRGYVNSLMSNFLHGATMQGDTVVLPPPIGDREVGVEKILQLTGQVGWRAGEAYGLWVMGEGFAAAGEYGRGLELVHRAIETAREIDHRQWLAASTMVLGAIHANILDFETARARLEEAFALAREVSSMHWIRTTAGLLASTYIAQNELSKAETLLDGALPPGTPAQTLGQRLSWAARVELALARLEPARALDLLDLLMRDASNVTPTTVIPHLWTLRARALLQQGKVEEAHALLEAARKQTHVTGQRPLEWRTLAVLVQSYRAAGREDEVARTLSAARDIVRQLAQTLPNASLREKFVARAEEWLRH